MLVVKIQKGDQSQRSAQKWGVNLILLNGLGCTRAYHKKNSNFDLLAIKNDLNSITSSEGICEQEYASVILHTLSSLVFFI